jgi:hypothetical protein
MSYSTKFLIVIPEEVNFSADNEPEMMFFEA